MYLPQIGVFWYDKKVVISVYDMCNLGKLYVSSMYRYLMLLCDI